MKKQVVIIGLGRFGYSLAEALFSMGHQVLAIDTDEKKVQNIAAHITHAVQADATDESVLRKLGVTNFDVAVVGIGSGIQHSVLCTILLKKLGVKYVIARAENELHGSILEKIGADKVIYIEHEMAAKIAHQLNFPEAADYVSVAPSYGVAKLVGIPRFVGVSLGDLGFSQRTKGGVVALLLRREKEVIVTPDPSEIVAHGDTLIVSGNDDEIERLLARPVVTRKEEKERKD